MTPAQRSRTGLASLPPELILRIIDLADPPSQVSLACTSKYIAGCCHSRFLRLRAAHKKYGVSSDLDPSTVPHLIRSALGYADPIDAWSVRSFELWGTRSSWDEWRPFNLEASTPYTVQDGEPLQWSFLEGETEALVGVFKDQMTGEEQRSAEDELREGKDGFLKAVLLALLPWLVDVKIVSGASDRSLSWLSKSFRWGRQRATWPPGFASILDVAVGVSSGTWRDEMNESLSAYTFVSVLQLPHIRSLQFRGLNTGDDDEGDVAEDDTVWHTATEDLPDSLPLERLILDDMHQRNSYFWDHFICEPAALEAVAFRGSRNYQDYEFDGLTEALSKWQSASLKRFMLYNAHNVRGYRCSAYHPDELEPCTSLRHVCIPVEDIEQEAEWSPEAQFGQEKISAVVERIFADPLEVLVVSKARDNPGRPEVMDTAIARMIEEEWYKGLQAVFLDQLEMTESPEREKILFQKAMRAGEKMGVDVYTKTNRRKKVHELDLLVPLGKYDLLTGPYGRKGKEGLKLDLKTGEWGPSGCNACGRCDDCLKVYVAELWDTIRPNPDE